MRNDAALLYAAATMADEWESEQRESYDVNALHQEYQERLYSEKAIALLRDIEE